MNMAIALAISRWNELAVGRDPVGEMRAWLVEVRRRAVIRDARARVEAVDLARGWFEACLRC
jgi:predicted RNA polymerase sigma factor